MKILETRVMRGPNQWSATQKNLIVLKLLVEGIESERLDDLLDKINVCFPGMAEKLEQADNDRTVQVQLAQLIASELQLQGGMPSLYSRIKATESPDVFFLVFSYEIEQAGVYAGRSAVEMIKAFLRGEKYDLSSDTDELIRLRSKYHIGPTSNYLLDEIKRRNIPFRRFDYGSLMTVGYGSRQKKIRTAVTDSTSGLGIELAGDKDETKRLLAENNCPVPRGIIVRSERELIERINEVQFPLVVKPLDGNHGRGVTTKILDLEKARYAYDVANRISDDVIVEEYVEGEDYRFLVINYKLVAVAKRNPAMICGDGRSTIQQLIDQENLNKDRGNSHKHVLAPIRIDGTTKKILNEKDLTLDSVLPAGEKLVLKDTANISAGGTAEDVTDRVHPYNVFMAERVARVFNLNICGVDIMTTSVEVPITRGVGAIIEVNAGPGLRMHSNPQKGTPRNIAAPIVDMLFPQPESSRIPIVAVTGTNGKTTTTRLIAHLAQEAGHQAGFCTTDGIYINGYMLFEGDCTGSVSAQNVLFDPSVDFAVLECARGGIIRSGLGFDQSDIAVITNITEDHLGLKDIHTLEELVRVKAVVARTVKKDGYAILNAEDDLSYRLKDDLNCRVALFGLHAGGERLARHIEDGGIIATIENDYLTIRKGENKIVIEKVQNIPLTFNGTAELMTKNILAAALAAYTSGIGTSSIKNGLMSFVPSPALTPGRMNLFEFKDFRLMVDYAHNCDGFSAIKKFLGNIKSNGKTAVIAVAGDRRLVDIRNIGRIVGETFDSVILRHNRDSRGASQEEISQLLKEGILERNPETKIKEIPDEKEAIDHAISHAAKDTFIFVCADKVPDTLEYINEWHRNDHQKKAM